MGHAVRRDGAGFVSRSNASLDNMLTVMDKVCGLFGLTVAEKTTDTFGPPPRKTLSTRQTVEASSQFPATMPRP